MDLFWVLLVNVILLVDASRNVPFAYQNELQKHCSSTKYTSLCVQTLREFRHESLQGLDFVSFLVNKTISDSNMLVPPLSSPMGSSELVSLGDSAYTLPSPSVSGTQHNLNTVSLTIINIFSLSYTNSNCTREGTTKTYDSVLLYHFNLSFIFSIKYYFQIIGMTF